MDEIPKETLEDACQLVKANSIQVGGGAQAGWRAGRLAGRQAGGGLAGKQPGTGASGLPPCRLTVTTRPVNLQGNKMHNIAIVYTPASNLRKSADMAVGQVRRIPGRCLLGRPPQFIAAPPHGTGTLRRLSCSLRCLLP